MLSIPPAATAWCQDKLNGGHLIVGRNNEDGTGMVLTVATPGNIATLDALFPGLGAVFFATAIGEVPPGTSPALQAAMRGRQNLAGGAKEDGSFWYINATPANIHAIERMIPGISMTFERA